MNKPIILLIILLLLTCGIAGAIESVESPKTCRLCGMDRTAFARSRMLLVHPDGTATGVCSLHCAAAEMQNKNSKKTGAIMVADYHTKELLNARTATWVVGGNKRGVMTALAKWAFAKAEDAREFVEQHGGAICSYDQAMNLATREVIDQTAEGKAVTNEILRDLL